MVWTDEQGIRRYSGTCFCFRHEHVALTASHCVVDTASAIELLFPRVGRSRRVERIERHPQADIALLVTAIQTADKGEGYPEHAFWDCVSNWTLGEEFFAYGFPSEGPTPGAGASAPTARLFKGHYQRFFDYDSHTGHRYLAGEMSVPAPGGLSGGPLFRPGAQQMLTGLVTASHESYAIVDSTEYEHKDGIEYRSEVRRVITYGVALMLNSVLDWLRSNVPDRPGVGWVG